LTLKLNRDKQKPTNEAKIKKRNLKDLRKGSIDGQGHEIESVSSIKPSKHDGSLLCKCTWKEYSEKEISDIKSISVEDLERTNLTRQTDVTKPEPSYVSMHYIRNHHPIKLLEYFEELVGLKRYKTQLE
jgi:hypothetical protein